MTPAPAGGRVARAPAAPAVAGIVLAAGASTRMRGANKLLCEVGGVPIVARVVDAMRAAGVGLVVVVTGHRAGEVAEAVAGRPLLIAHNADHAAGMGGSIRVGVAAARAAFASGVARGRALDAVMVCPGDLPELAAADIRAVLEAAGEARSDVICAPVFEGRRGHPVLFGAALFAELAALAGDVGAREVLVRHPDAVREVAVASAGVIADVDTPEALAAARGAAGGAPDPDA